MNFVAGTILSNKKRKISFSSYRTSNKIHGESLPIGFNLLVTTMNEPESGGWLVEKKGPQESITDGAQDEPVAKGPRNRLESTGTPATHGCWKER